MIRIFFLLLFVLASPSYSLAGLDFPNVTVYGTAKTEVVPDELNWRLSVKTLGGNVEQVASAHVAEVEVVLAALTELGSLREEIQTSQMQLRENWIYQNNSRVKDGYLASTRVTFKMSGFNLYLGYWKTLSKAQNVSIDTVSFSFSKRDMVQDKLRVAAVKNAKIKAESLAAALETTVLEPLIIEELGDFTSSPRPALMMEASGARDAAQPVSPGKEIVRGSVKVVFRIGKK